MLSASRLTLAALLLVGCAGPEPKEDQPAAKQGSDPAIARMVEELVTAAELRADLATMRVFVPALSVPVEEARNIKPSVPERIADEIVHALSHEVNVLDHEFGNRPQGEDVRDVAAEIGATHVLLGDMALDDQGYAINTRLVDARSLLIVATARGVVSRAPFLTGRTPVRGRALASPSPRDSSSDDQSALTASTSLSSVARAAEQAGKPSSTSGGPALSRTGREEPLRVSQAQLEKRARSQPAASKARSVEPPLARSASAEPASLETLVGRRSSETEELLSQLLDGRYDAPRQAAGEAAERALPRGPAAARREARRNSGPDQH